MAYYANNMVPVTPTFRTIDPWYDRRQPSAYGDITPLQPARYSPSPFPIPAALTAHEVWVREQARRDAEFDEFQSYMARTPGLPDPAPSSTTTTTTTEKPEYVKTKFAKACRAAYAKVVGAKRWLGGKKKVGTDKYKGVAFACQRLYWLKMTAYRQSKWPHLLRVLWYLLLAVLALALLAYTAKLKMAQWEDEAAQPRDIEYVLVPRFRAWSVSKPRCEPCHCPCDVSCLTPFG
ncbi:hypothetical protein F5Y05DRAFT_411684 [Hypoxylon sp. FL0543]|nr:hypothetical protein F5Y05DRAFT_411684 [Hypoxylon sp. FL0543]